MKRKQSIVDFRQLSVYQKSLTFHKQMYDLIETFPPCEKNNLADQLRRASTSICANIAEGVGNFYYGKERDRINSAIGSLSECRSFLDMAYGANYITSEECEELDGHANEILKMLIGLINRIEKMEKGGTL